MSNAEHNGWTNYATWLVNLELFDGLWLPEYFEHNDLPDDLAEWCKEYVEDYIEQSIGTQDLASGWAFAFIADVDWQSIANHLLDDAEWPVANDEEA